MFRRHLLGFLLLAFALPLVAAEGDSDYYLTPKTIPEFWRAARFEIRTGNFERADDRLKSLLARNPTSKDFFELVENPPQGVEPGMAPILRLRNIPRWYADDRANKEAKARVEELIDKITKAVEAELANEKRIRRFANRLSSESPEEAAFSLKELQRSGESAVPILTTMLTEKSGETIQAGIFMAIPHLGLSTVPGFLAYLPNAEGALKGDLIDALRKRNDFRTLVTAADRDPIPTLLYIIGHKDTTDTVRAKAKTALVALTARDIDKETDPERKTPQGQLTATARKFYDGTSNLTTLAGDDKNDPIHKLWTWDGKTVASSMVSRTAASEYYGLRYARWALDLQPDNVTAQKVFLGIAIENQVLRTGGDKPLSRTSPELHGALITAPFATLSELLDEAIAGKKTAVVLAAVRALGERADSKAAIPSPKPGSKEATRPPLLVKALDYPDPRVQFAAADALLRIPGAPVEGKPGVYLPVHGRTTEIVKILAAAVLADSPDGAKQKVLLGDPDAIRADGVAVVLQRLGYEVEVVPTGRQLIRRIQERSDIDLVLLDRHLPNPLLPDLVAQLKADRRGKTLPTMVLASPDGIIPVNLFTALARLATVVAFEDLPDAPWYNFYPATKDEADKIAKLYEEMQATIAYRYQAQRKRMREIVIAAGYTMSTVLEDRIDYLALQTIPTKAMSEYASKFLAEERVKVFNMLSPEAKKELRDSPTRAIKGRIQGDSIPTAEEAERIIALMRLTNRYEAVLQVERLPGFNKLWNIMWDPNEPRLPLITALRSQDVEMQLKRQLYAYRGLRIIPAVFTEEGFKEELAQLTDNKAPLMTPAEKKEYAKVALTWLKKMATGEVTGYQVAPAEAAVRSALQSDELAPLAIEAAGRFPNKDIQQDLATLTTKEMRPAPIRILAAEVLAKHVQTYGKHVTEAQAKVMSEIAATTPDPELKSRLLALLGTLASDSSKSGDALKTYTPKPPMKEEGKGVGEEKKDPPPEEKK